MYRQILMNNKGFTLMEMLVVLMIVGIIAWILSFANTITFEEGSFERMISNLENDVYFAQVYANTYDEDTRITFYSDEYVLEYGGAEKVYHYDTKFEVSSTFDNNTIVFNENGNINEAGHVNFCDLSGCEEIVFNLGFGRMYVR